MTETVSAAIAQLQRKGCIVLDSTVLVPIDHGCGNRSFGRMDMLRGKKFNVHYVDKTATELSKLAAKVGKGVEIHDAIALALQQKGGR